MSPFLMQIDIAFFNFIHIFTPFLSSRNPIGDVINFQNI